MHINSAMHIKRWYFIQRLLFVYGGVDFVMRQETESDIAMQLIAIFIFLHDMNL